MLAKVGIKHRETLSSGSYCDRASRLALKPLRPCGFSAYQQYGHFCNNFHNFRKFENLKEVKNYAIVGCTSI